MDSIYTLIKRAQNDDSEAKEEIINQNSGLIWSVVKRFYGRGDPDDLYQLGAIGLLKSIENFDFNYNVRFSTYAVPLIMGEIKRFLRDDGTIKVSRSLKELSYRIKKVQEATQEKENRDLSLFELSEKLGESKENLILALEASRTVESIYSNEYNNDSQKGMMLIEKINYGNDAELTLSKLCLKEALKHLNSKERQIIWMRYFQDSTQSDIAKKIGISQVQVSRMEKRILQQLKNSMQ